MNVPRETTDKFDKYLNLLHKWQKTINLVSSETLAEAEERHFADSRQLVDLVPSTARVLMDWGSGAGFPGLVLAMQRPDLTIHLVEADQRKCAFLRVVSRETATPVKIHDERVERLSPELIQPDIITARAFASLKDICRYGVVWAQVYPALRFILPKGQSADEEIAEAQQLYSFEVERHVSSTDLAASILILSALCIK